MPEQIKSMDYALIGFPLGHSVSPFIHAELFKLAGINTDCVYSLRETPPEKLEGSYDFLKGLKGFNITIPLKTKIIPFCSKLDITAERCGAVNCVDNIHGGIGYNTDVYGFTKSVELMGARLNSRVLVIGYGGVGRMFASEALRQGALLTVSVLNEQELSGFDMKAEAVISEQLKGEFDLIINATPQGMYPHTEQCAINFDGVEANYALDAVFNPLKTKFMSEAEKKGMKTLNGVPMLVWQAVRSHEIWNGSVYNNGDIEELIEKTQVLLAEKNKV